MKQWEKDYKVKT